MLIPAAFVLSLGLCRLSGFVHAEIATWIILGLYVVVDYLDRKGHLI
jgi:hypothetical protein